MECNIKQDTERERKGRDGMGRDGKGWEGEGIFTTSYTKDSNRRKKRKESIRMKKEKKV